MDWLTPTLRLVRWSPLVATLAMGAGTLTMLRVAERPVRGLEVTVASAIAVIGALCGLQDPARDLVHAVPLQPWRRLLHRLLVLLPPLGLGLVIIRRVATAWFPNVPDTPGWAALTAFGAVGVALSAMLTRRLGPRAVDAAVSVMLALLVVGVSSEALDVPLGIAMPWWRWPIAVASLAVVTTIVATARGVEA